jgi:hypothetical protein
MAESVPAGAEGAGTAEGAGAEDIQALQESPEDLFGQPFGGEASVEPPDGASGAAGAGDGSGAAGAGAGVYDLGISDATRAFTRLIGVASANALRGLEQRIDGHERFLASAQEVAGAKQLALNAYQYEKRLQEVFLAKHGAYASAMSEEDIRALYSNDYFYDRMRALGLFKEENKGSDVNTRNMLIRAQAMLNIPINARLDTNTKRGLLENSNLRAKDYLNGEHPSGMWVVINKSYRILTIYVDNQIFKKLPIAVGKDVSDTPTGQFKFVSKFVDPRWGGGGYAEPIAGGDPSNPLGHRWIGISKGGGGRYGVHGNASPYSIGTNASHGCVRMINSDVEEIYDYIEIGTPVWIGLEADLEGWGIYQTLEPYVPSMPDYRDYLPPVPTEEAGAEAEVA